MSTVAHATVSQLSSWLTTQSSTPDDAERLLQRASECIDEYVLASFDVDDETKLATDSGTAASLADATCAQVEYWLEVGEEHDVDGIGGQIQITGGGSFAAPPELAPRARRILKAAQLMDLGWVGV